MRTFITKTMFYCMNTIGTCRFKKETQNQKRKSSPEVITARFRLSIGPRGFVCVFLTIMQFSVCLQFNNHDSNVAVFSSRYSHQWVGLLACVSPSLKVGTVLLLLTYYTSHFSVFQTLLPYLFLFQYGKIPCMRQKRLCKTFFQ